MRILSLAAASGTLLPSSIPTAMTEFPSSFTLFSSDFRQPTPPTVSAEYKASWNQHYWDSNVSHIASGFLYNSPSNSKVRVDQAYDSTLGSSLFDYTDVTPEGVLNLQWNLSPAISSPPEQFRGYVEPAFPLISADFLAANSAVFGGIVNDPSVGEVATWKVLYQGKIPATILLDRNGIIQGYDFWSPERRTYVVTRFFNIILGPIKKEVFDFPVL